MKTNLHMFSNEVPELIIAYDAQDAVKVWEETVGETYVHCEHGGDFVQIKDDSEISLCEDELIEHPTIPASAVKIEQGEHSFTHKATARAWCDARGREYFACTEY